MAIVGRKGAAQQTIRLYSGQPFAYLFRLNPIDVEAEILLNGQKVFLGWPLF